MSSEYFRTSEFQPVPVKTHEHCKAGGCFAIGNNQPYEEYPNVLFCDLHFLQILKRTVDQIHAEKPKRLRKQPENTVSTPLRVLVNWNREPGSGSLVQ